MQEILDVLNNLRQISGNAQLDYLEFVKNDLLKQVFEYTYNTHKKYKISEGKFNKFIPFYANTEKKPLTQRDWNDFCKLLDMLVTIKSAKDEVVNEVARFIYMFEQHEFLKMVLFKDLRVGMNIKKFQKIWPDFCILYPYMGCCPFNTKNLNALVFPCYAQTKMDGTYCNVIIDTKNKTVEYASRQSKPQPMKGCFLDKFCDNWVGDEHFTDKFVLTGEALVWDNIKNKPLPRKLSNGILRREVKTQDELDRIHYVCWDFIPYDKFIEKQWNVPYKDRYTWLKTRLNDFMGKLHIVNTWEVNSLEEAEKIFDEQYANGEEGIVLKELSQIWQDGKPKGQVKMKAEKDCDLRMIGFYEGKGNYSGMCGNIQCISEDNLLEVYVKPRTPKDAMEIWNNQEFYKNKILAVTFNEVITSETKDKPSLYLPRFVEIRDDKSVADTYQMIKEL